MIEQLNSNISVVIATLNEEEGIGPTIDEMQKILKNPYLVVVDGNSVDKTLEIAKNMAADVMLQEGKG
ncbi:MAG TPA: glycosyltransferase, partial [Candidatus Acidoferrales bacterium]|nr:glycosyltransferase [Candidatus Acidoferrales bacterium]